MVTPQLREKSGTSWKESAASPSEPVSEAGVCVFDEADRGIEPEVPSSRPMKSGFEGPVVDTEVDAEAEVDTAEDTEATLELGDATG